LGVRRNSSNVATRAELGRTPLYPFVVGAVLRYWYKLNTQSKSEILKQAYKSEMDLNKSRILSWLTSVVNIHDLSQWKTGRNQTNLLIKNIVWDLQTQYKSYILNYLKSVQSNGSNDKLRTYCWIKNNHDMETYLTSNIPRVYRNKITAIRIGSHDLEIERGRYTNTSTPPQNRFCKFCPDNIEDECHFMMSCSLFKTKRTELISMLNLDKTFTCKNELSKFIILFTNELNNEESCFIVGQYIHECLKLRASSGVGPPSD
jgi:hypothetical protein